MDFFRTNCSVLGNTVQGTVCNNYSGNAKYQLASILTKINKFRLLVIKINIEKCKTEGKQSRWKEGSVHWSRRTVITNKRTDFRKVPPR